MGARWRSQTYTYIHTHLSAAILYCEIAQNSHLAPQAHLPVSFLPFTQFFQCLRAPQTSHTHTHLNPLLPTPHPFTHPQAWPANGSQSKFKLVRGQLLLQPLRAPVIFPCRRGFFCQRPEASRRGLWLCLRERRKRERGWRRSAHRISGSGTQEGLLQRGFLDLGLYSERTQD